MSSHNPNIAVILPNPLSTYGHQVANGIATFARMDTQWRLLAMIGDHSQAGGFRERLSADGAIVSKCDLGLLPDDIPTVFIGEDCGTRQHGRLHVDNDAIGVLVAEHFLDRGVRCFSFLGSDTSYNRRLSFRRRIEQAPQCEYIPPIEDISENVDQWNADWHVDLVTLSQWIRSLPKPIGLMASTDLTGRQIARAAQMADCLVPEQVAIVGVGNNELVCGMSDPPLSSVDRAGYEAGYRAGEMLSEMFRGQTPPAEPMLIPPGPLIARESSDIIAFDDDEVATAVSFIRANATRPITVNDILERIPASRRSLERRFKQALGRSLHNEIHRLRINRAKHLLCQTLLSVSEVAGNSGFNSLEHFSNSFKAATGFSPSTYREQYRLISNPRALRKYD